MSVTSWTRPALNKELGHVTAFFVGKERANASGAQFEAHENSTCLVWILKQLRSNVCQKIQPQTEFVARILHFLMPIGLYLLFGSPVLSASVAPRSIGQGVGDEKYDEWGMVVYLLI